MLDVILRGIERARRFTLGGNLLRLKRQVIAVLCAAALSFALGCSDESPLDGRYVGDTVTLTVLSGVIQDVQFRGISCQVDHPEVDGVVLCSVRPTMLPTDTASASGLSFNALFGDVQLQGAFAETTVEGRWALTGTCFDGTLCEADGAWTAEWAETVSPPDRASDPQGQSDDAQGNPSDASMPEVGPGTTATEPPIDANANQTSAAAAIDELRERMGLGPMQQDGNLNAASQAHADYFVRHASAYQSSGLNPHNQNPEWSEGFTGETLGDRLAFHNVSGGMGAGEVMAFTGTVDGALTGWIETLYHRIPFVHPNSTRYGWGMAVGGDARCEVVDYLYGQADKPGPGRWPLPDASDVPASWHGYESPQPPLPAGESYPSGPVVTITFKSGSQPQLTSASLVDSVGEPVAAQVQSPANDPWLTDTWSLYAYDPLASGQTYTVTFDGVVSGQPLTEVWQFTTR